ncbi:SIMPL domain-containing protein [Ferruginibacter sp.]
MKKLTVLTAALLLCMLAKPQSTIDTRKYIEVTGSAEMQVQPDEIELEVVIQEYDRAGKKVRLDDVNDGFVKVLQKNKVNTDSLKFIDLQNHDWYWLYWWEHRGDYYQTKTITIKLQKSTNIINLVEELNEKWVQSIRISKSENSKITEYRKQVKTEAAKAAKAKATYLLESLGEELGGVLSIEEVPEANNDYNYWYRPVNLVSNSNVSMPGGYAENGIKNVTAIKLRYEVKIKFAIQ